MATTTEYLAPNTLSNNFIDMMLIGIDTIRPSPLNPRKHFNDAALAELAESIREHGLIEPIVVRAPHHTSVDYELICGERRWRAAKLAGLQRIPARVLVGVDDATALRLALVENLQRADLDPIEEAEGFRQLNKVCGLKQAEIAAAVKRSQPTIANAMRLLDLPEDVQERIRRRELSVSHGVALAKYKDFPPVASKLAEMTVKYKWTSAELEGSHLNGHYTLASDGLIRYLRDAMFDTAVCQKCPFNARRKDGGWEWCLRPDHFDELQAAAKAQRAAEAHARLEAARAAAAASGAPASDGAPASGLPKLRELQWDSYDSISRYDKPSGCTEQCPCRGQALDDKGNIVAICTNPKRYRQLKAQDARAENKRRKARYDAALKVLRERMDALDTIGSRELAVLVMALWSTNQGYAMREHAEAAAEQYGLSLTTHYEAWPQNIPHYDELARHGELDILRYALESVLRADLAGAVEQPASKGGWTAWYLGLEPDKPAAATADAADGGDDAEKDDEEQCCTNCGRKLSDAELDVDEGLCFDCLGDEDEGGGA